MADMENHHMENHQQTREDLLKWIQMEALGIKRREKITTADFTENRSYTTVSELESMRKALGGDYQPAKQGRTKIAGWQNVYREIQDDGTAALGDLRSVNEGLGQTHRAKLMEDERIRTYTGEPDYRKGRHHNESSGKTTINANRKASRNQLATARIVRARVVKGSSDPAAVAQILSRVARVHLPNVTPTDKSPVSTSSKVKAMKGKRSAQATECFQRQQRAIQVPILADPRAFIASIQGVKLQASQQKQVLVGTNDVSSQAHDKTTAAPASEKTSSPQAAIAKTAPQVTRQSAQNTETLRLSSIKSKEDTNANADKQSRSSQLESVYQLSGKSVPTSTPETNGAVPLAFLMSLNLNFTPEQLSQLKAHAKTHSAPNTKLSASPLSNDEVSGQILNDDSVAGAMAVSPTSSEAPPSSRAKSTSVSTTASAALAKVSPAATASQDPPVASALSAPSKADKLPKEKTSSLQAPSIRKVTQSDTAKSSNPIGLTELQPDVSTNATRTTFSLDSNRVSAPTTSRSEILRQQREMIIGSQVYKNRYSHVAGSLVDKFRSLSLADPAPVPVQAPPAKPAAIPAVRNPPAAASAPAAQSITETKPTPPAQKAPSAAPLLRPRFIPDNPVPHTTLPGVLAPMTVNPTIDANNPFGPAKKGQGASANRFGGPSLPPHLMGKVASSDLGAAARAQYGSQ